MMATKRRKTDVVQFKLRLMESLRKKLEVAARSQHRSLNSEILHRLESTFSPEIEDEAGIRERSKVA